MTDGGGESTRNGAHQRKQGIVVSTRYWTELGNSDSMKTVRSGDSSSTSSGRFKIMAGKYEKSEDATMHATCFTVANSGPERVMIGLSSIERNIGEL